MLVFNEAGMLADIYAGRVIDTPGEPLAALLAAGDNSHIANLGGVFLAIFSSMAGFLPQALAHLSAIACPLNVLRIT